MNGQRTPAGGSADRPGDAPRPTPRGAGCNPNRAASPHLGDSPAPADRRGEEPAGGMPPATPRGAGCSPNRAASSHLGDSPAPADRETKRPAGLPLPAARAYLPPPLGKVPVWPPEGRGSQPGRIPGPNPKGDAPPLHPPRIHPQLTPERIPQPGPPHRSRQRLTLPPLPIPRPPDPRACRRQTLAHSRADDDRAQPAPSLPDGVIRPDRRR